MVSKAFDRSIRMAAEYPFLSRKCFHFSITESICPILSGVVFPVDAKIWAQMLLDIFNKSFIYNFFKKFRNYMQNTYKTVVFLNAIICLEYSKTS